MVVGRHRSQAVVEAVVAIIGGEDSGYHGS